MNSLEEYRKFYARFVCSMFGDADGRVLEAFSVIPREHYMGSGPWMISSKGSAYMDTGIDDPRVLYQDILVALLPERYINNGQPSLHARAITACAPKEGDSVLHIGAGTGYYTAILAYLVGATGNVYAYELDASLADRARNNLAHLPNAKVLNVSGAEGTLPPADIIYVSAAAPRPMPAWLNALKIGGRLIFPLTPNRGVGCMLLVTREAEEKFAAKSVIGAAFTPCVGAEDERTSEVLAKAFKSQPVERVKSLRRNTASDKSAWCVGDGWWLSTDEP
jgi:protein-L-isoaspartate(D-aspartate) O-methyltransferase